MREVSTPLNKELKSSIGSIIFQMDRIGDLPNVVGGRDIYGGKVDLGSTEIKLVEIVDKRYVHLAVSDERKTNTETTITRYGERNNKTDVDVSVGRQADFGTIEVVLDTAEEKVYSSDGYDIKITDVRDSSISYVVTEVE